MGNLKPDAVFEGLQHIDIAFLKEKDIKGILLDIDNTLVDLSKVLSEEIIQWVQNVKNEGIKVCILTNTNKQDKLTSISSKLGIDYVSFAKKPMKSGYLRASKKLELECKNIAMIGDQILTDVIGANRVGMFSIYVRPIDKKEFWYTAWKRPIENLILKHYGY